MSDKYIIRNCPCLEQSDLDKDIYNSCLGATDYIGMCKDCTDCVMKQIVDKCSKAHGQIIGYEKGKIYDGKNLIEANLPLATINPLAKEILELLDIQEVE
jgi:hypothetical protein